MIPHFSIPELLIIGAIGLIFFGSNKLPETARSFGKALKGFKEELKDVTEGVTAQPAVAKVEVTEAEAISK